jgi:uncharacterized sporulation protein YeaH/YhbH (DUF444 family)
MALAAPYTRRLREAEEELQQLLAETAGDEIRAKELVEEIEHLRARARAVPFIDTFDLRYANRVKQAAADDPGGDVLRHGRVRFDGSGA